MTDIMYPLSLKQLCNWVDFELESKGSVFGLPQSKFFKAADFLPLKANLLGQQIDNPLGVAAGPHTQLAQNILTAYFAGARFIELKTVQTLDELEITKPCIDLNDEGYNCEWSQELQIPQSIEEYIKAWVLIHHYKNKLQLGSSPDQSGFIFNLSVGYNLEGIKKDNVQQFLDAMCTRHEQLTSFIEIAQSHFVDQVQVSVAAPISNNVTLSTMHGCPPEEIEKIATYLLRDQKLHTTVKLNPTLLGQKQLREILNQKLGFDIEVPDEAFAHDPNFDDAMNMVSNLKTIAKQEQRYFGVKLSNTLETNNIRHVLPKQEAVHYMSGRALHPLTVTIASRIAQYFDGDINISFAGGVDAFNIVDVLQCGCKPVTVCSDILKPGGYGRLHQYLKHMQQAYNDALLPEFDTLGTDVQKLEQYAQRVITDQRYGKPLQPISAKTSRKLNHFDCAAAPCREGCPANQNIPDYLYLASQGRWDDALEVILRENPLPGITGCVCDHPCQTKCVRSHYDQPLAIREIKRFITQQAQKRRLPQKQEFNGVRVAIIGAGPGGLAAAYYLCLAGFRVTVFDGKPKPGGMVQSVIPSYRLATNILVDDIEKIQALGGEFRFNERIGTDIPFEELENQGYRYVFISVGAQNGKRLGIPGENSQGVHDCLDFLAAVQQKQQLEVGSSIVIIGGGNSAMDAGRTAWRVVKDQGSVTLLYRRTIAQMPADPEEIEALQEEGVTIEELVAPVRIITDSQQHVNGVECLRMELGQPDASGRRAPQPIENSQFIVPCDTVIVAISQGIDTDFLSGSGIETTSSGNIIVDWGSMETSRTNVFAGGDGVRGAASIINAAADARRAAASICERENISMVEELSIEKTTSLQELYDKRHERLYPQPLPRLEVSKRKSFEVVDLDMSAEQAKTEAQRCLQCDRICSLCVTVCPNRANIMYHTPAKTLNLPQFTVVDGTVVAEKKKQWMVAQTSQVLNIAQMCNECGNCATFCPTAGAPYKDKPRLYFNKNIFDNESNGFLFEGNDEGLQLSMKIDGNSHTLKKQSNHYIYESSLMSCTLDMQNYDVISHQAHVESGSVSHVIIGELVVIYEALQDFAQVMI